MPAAEEAASERHAVYYLRFVAGRERAWHSATPQQARADIRPVLENVRVAWQWAIRHRAWPLLDEALFSLFGYYLSEGLLNESIDLLSQLAAHLHPSTPGSIEARLLSRALVYQSGLVARRELKTDTALELALSLIHI